MRLLAGHWRDGADRKSGCRRSGSIQRRVLGEGERQGRVVGQRGRTGHAGGHSRQGGLLGQGRGGVVEPRGPQVVVYQKQELLPGQGSGRGREEEAGGNQDEDRRRKLVLIDGGSSS
jgi:hypothetical protein